MHPAEILDLTPAERKALFDELTGIIENYAQNVGAGRVAPGLDPGAVRALLRGIDYAAPREPMSALKFAAECLRLHQVHTAHPMYYGLFNPRPAAMGIVADTLVAAFNPQLAAWSHNPFAVEVEAHLIRAFGRRFGYSPESVDGTFCSGGAEANHTALLTAMLHRFPQIARGGVRALEGEPVFYVSTQAHDSFRKAARLCGLGTDAVREISVRPDLTIDTDLLRERIARDRREGALPFMLVGTAGSTGAGIVDPLTELASIARETSLWFHTDAAWGGAAVFVEELRPALDGIELSDSITFDAHKWLSVPMGAGIYVTRHPDILEKTFRVSADYMPKEASSLDVTDTYVHSIQWSRRFIGLKVFLSLLTAGWDGYAAVIRHQAAMGDFLRKELAANGWRVVNSTTLPVVCFVDGEDIRGAMSAPLCQRVVASGSAWISTVEVAGGVPALRACITNYATTPDHVRALVRLLNEERRRLRT